MSTVGKALSLLDAVARAERGMGLAEIARLCGTDKATARRLLVDLGRHGFIEQDLETKKYVESQIFWVIMILILSSTF